MNIHYLQHVPFEELGSIEADLTGKKHQLTSTNLYKNESLPTVDDIDWLIIMGGPMGVNDEDQYHWLKQEKQFIKQAIESGKIVLGICLGAQLIAAALGARVYKNRHSEIGWFDINRHPDAEETILSSAIPPQVEVFHWHGDTFDIPAGAKSLAFSAACPNQGFILDNRVVGLQFHLETTPTSAQALINKCRDELDGSLYVQTESEIVADPQRFSRINQIMANILNCLEKQANK
ncbi:MAG: amidotransferase [Deltaproteobacteria bacterium]|nr:MAG: amidotransferase [Deltaproteobacteria bacterium]